MQLELIEKITNALDAIDEYANLEERFILRDFILCNLNDQDLLIKAYELMQDFEVDEEDKEELVSIVKKVRELIESGS